MYLIVGNWCPGPGEKGFSVYEYNSESGHLTFLNHSANEIAASFLTMGTAPDIAYATHETDTVIDGLPANQIITLNVSKPGINIEIVNRKASLGPNPTWICNAFQKNYLLITHHGGFCNTSTIQNNKEGNPVEKIIYDEPHVILYRLNKKGFPDKAVDAFLPCRPDDNTGQISRTHSIQKAPGKNLYIICDKGLDIVIAVTVDFEEEKIIPLDSIAVPRHSAPRYGTFHQSLPIFYANMEGCTDIYAFSYDELGNLKIIQTLNLPCEKNGKDIMPSDIILSPDGQKLYVGLRGINQIAVICLDVHGKMSLQQLCHNADGTPNALRISPDGKYLFVTNIFEKVITKFEVKKEGSLDYLGIVAHDCCPASMLFIK